MSNVHNLLATGPPENLRRFHFAMYKVAKS